MITEPDKVIYEVVLAAEQDNGKSNSIYGYGDNGCQDLYGRNRGNFVKILNGWFHGVLVDMQRREMLLFNDRYGVQRLYYHEDRDAFLFSAEAKAILKVRPELRQIDSQGLGEFLACDAVLENRSLFRKIYLLPGGSLWRFKAGEVSPTRHCYFKPQEWEEQLY